MVLRWEPPSLTEQNPIQCHGILNTCPHIILGANLSIKGRNSSSIFPLWLQVTIAVLINQYRSFKTKLLIHSQREEC